MPGGHAASGHHPYNEVDGRVLSGAQCVLVHGLLNNNQTKAQGFSTLSGSLLPVQSIINQSIHQADKQTENNFWHYTRTWEGLERGGTFSYLLSPFPMFFPPRWRGSGLCSRQCPSSGPLPPPRTITAIKAGPLPLTPPRPDFQSFSTFRRPLLSSPLCVMTQQLSVLQSLPFRTEPSPHSLAHHSAPLAVRLLLTLRGSPCASPHLSSAFCLSHGGLTALS